MRDDFSSSSGLSILQVVTDTDYRGAQVFARDLGEALIRRSHTVRTVALADGASQRALAFASLGPSRLHPRTLVKLSREMKSVDITIAHGSTTLMACALAGFRARRPFIYRQISDSLFWAPTWSRRLRVTAGLRRARGVVALWDGSASTLHEHFSVPLTRMHVVPNGVSRQRFHPPSVEHRRLALRRFSVPEGVPLALSIGALEPEKGVDIAIAAMGELHDAHLLVVGAGTQEAILRSLAELAAPGRVHFLGPLEDPYDAFAAADVLVMPSRGGDSMPAVLIEAGLCGVAAVSTPVAAIPRIVVDGITGFLVPIDDVRATSAGVRKALAFGEHLGRAARVHCLARFDIDVVASEWERALLASLD